MADFHQSAQELSAAAELARSQKDWAKARSLYAEAAEVERESLRSLPAGRPRSRGILAVSLASLLFKAGLYERVEAAVGGFLSEELPEPFRDQLRELLSISWEELLLQQNGLQSTEAEIQVALRGGRIGHGSAPAEIAIRYLSGFHSLAYRVAESEAGLPLRTHGQPPREIQEALQARATQPSAGSYRFSLKFAEAHQGELFPETAGAPRPDAGRLSETVVGVLRAIATHDVRSLEQAIPSHGYRLALARLARNVVPSGDAIGEVEIRTAQQDALGAVRLVPGLRRTVNETIRALTPAVDPKDREETLYGTLRAVNLDNHWLKIVSENGQPIEIHTNPDELDDVIGPMINRQVAARVLLRPKGRARLLDIEPQED